MMNANKQQNHARGRSGLVLALIGLLSVTGLVKGPTTPASAQAEARSWSYTGSLNIERADHTATLLSDGKVLVVGGYNHPYAAGSAELYDPITGLWSVTGNLNVPRSAHTATLLEDGKVLVAGGVYGGAINTTAEVYDPVTGLWSLTSNLNAVRYSHTATRLRDGKVLIAGGGDTLFLLATNAAEVYDPATRTWSLTGNLNDRRLGHTATLLANGEVLVAGGVNDFEGQLFLNSAELYDPATKTWRYTGSLNTWRADYAAVLLLNGDVLAAGGDYSQNNPSEIYHVAKGTWSNNAGFSLRFYPTLTLLQNGKALTTGGAIFGRYGFSGPGSTFSDAHLYNPATGSWKQTAKLNEPRALHTATLLSDGKVLVVGGSSSTELYDPEILDPAPKIVSASVSGIKLFITGENFDDGAVILLNGEEQKSKQPAANPQTSLIGKKAGKKIKAGDKLQVRNPDGTLSEEFIFTGSQDTSN